MCSKPPVRPPPYCSLQSAGSVLASWRPGSVSGAARYMAVSGSESPYDRILWTIASTLVSLAIWATITWHPRAYKYFRARRHAMPKAHSSKVFNLILAQGHCCCIACAGAKYHLRAAISTIYPRSSGLGNDLHANLSRQILAANEHKATRIALIIVGQIRNLTVADRLDSSHQIMLTAPLARAGDPLF